MLLFSLTFGLLLLPRSVESNGRSNVARMHCPTVKTYWAAWDGINDGCDRNWLDSTISQRHNFTNAPAILGNDGSVCNFCCESCIESDEWVGWDCTCIDGKSGSFQRLWMMGLFGPNNWSPKVNIEFVECAAKGKLPGQRNNDIVMAQATFEALDHTVNSSSLLSTRDDTKDFAVELCYLHQFCKNVEELWNSQAGDTFNCVAHTSALCRSRDSFGCHDPTTDEKFFMAKVTKACLGGVVALVACGLVFLWWRWRQKSRKTEKQPVLLQLEEIRSHQSDPTSWANID